MLVMRKKYNKKKSEMLIFLNLKN